MYAAAPEMIFSRRTRFCYGLQISTPFALGLRQDLKYVEATTGKVFCQKYFSQVIKLDELVEHDQVGSFSICMLLSPVSLHLRKLAYSAALCHNIHQTTSCLTMCKAKKPGPSQT